MLHRQEPSPSTPLIASGLIGAAAVTTISLLPPELLAEIAAYLLPPAPGRLNLLLHGPNLQADESVTGRDDDEGWQQTFRRPHAARLERAQALAAARDLGTLRLVDRRWQEVATSLLFQHVQVGDSERLAWLTARPSLARQIKHLTIHTRALSEISSASSDRFGSGAALQALVRKMTTLRFMAIQGPVPAAITNSLSDPLTGQKLCIGTLESVSLVCAWSSHDDPSISARGPAILRLPPILSFLRSHPNLQVIHLAGCQLSSSQLGFALGSLADAGVRLRVLSVEVSSRLAQGFEDVVVNRLRCLVECARTMGGSLECVRLFGEHAEFSAKTLHEDLEDFVPALAALTALSQLNFGLVALDASSPVLATLVRAWLLPVCPSLLPSQVYWMEEKIGHVSLVNPFSHRLGRAWMSAADHGRPAWPGLSGERRARMQSNRSSTV